MLKLTRWTALALSALTLTACASSMNVSSNVDRAVDFGRYRTFAWGPADALPTGDARLDANPFFKDHMQGEVERGLAGRGITLTSSATPDLVIHYHANISQRMDVRRVDESRSYSYAGDNQISEYEAGTIVLDLVDVSTQKVIWRGWAQDAVKDMLSDEDTMAEKIREAVSRMLAQLQPRL